MYNNENEIALKMEKINAHLKDYKVEIENKIKNSHNEQNEKIEEYLHKLEIKNIAQERPGSYFISTNNIAHEMESKNRAEYIRSGKMDNNFSTKAQNYLSEETDGNIVKEHFHSKIIEFIQPESIFRQIAKVETVQGNNNEFIQSFDELSDIGWVGEIETRSTTNSPSLKKLTIQLKEMYAQPRISANMLNDASVDLDRFIIQKIGEAFRKIENKAFLFGDGKNEPSGILTYNDNIDQSLSPYKIDPIIQVINNEKTQQITAEDILNLIFSVDAGYLANACFVMHPNALRILRGLKDQTSGNYLWQPSFNIGVPDRLMGFPIYLSRDMQSGEKSGDVPMIFGDFKRGFLIIDCIVNNFIRDPYTEKPFVKFYISKRLGASVIDPRALRIFKMQ